MTLDQKTIEVAAKNKFEVKGYSFDAKPEELRMPRIVRVNYTYFKISFLWPIKKLVFFHQVQLHSNLDWCYSTLYSEANNGKIRRSTRCDH